jgi:hypothetical protein
MKTETRMALTRDLEKMRISPLGSTARWIFALWTLAEFVAGGILVSGSTLMTIESASEHRLYWAGFSMLMLGIIALGHAGYMLVKRSFNRRLSYLIDAVLESSAPTGG